MKKTRTHVMTTYRTLGQLLLQQAETYGRKPYLYWHDEVLSYEQFAERTLRVANGLAAEDIGKKDHVALLLTNQPAFLYSFFACALLGAVVVPLNPALKAPEVAYALRNSEAQLLIADEGLRAQARTAAADQPALRRVLFSGGSGAHDDAFESLLHAPATPPDVTVTPTDLMSIIYTSGTTGKPKGVMLTHANYDYDSEAYAIACKASPDDRFMCVLPLFHVNAQVASTLAALRKGGALILMEGFSPSTFLPAVERYEATSFSGVPTVYAILNDLEEADQYDLSSLRVCICGAAPMPVEVFNRFERTYNAFILEGYGLSEGTCVSTLNPLDGRPRKIGSIGVPLPGQEVRIVGDGGDTAATGEVGEIVIRGPNVMEGYYRNPAATDEALKEGWLHTGDLGYVDADGYFYIEGRKKEMIIRGGENIYPKEIEEVLYTHEAVKEAAVIGIPDEVWGEEVAAVLVLQDDQTLTPADVRAYCQDHLADYKCPRVVYYRDTLPKTATGKIQKVALAEAYADESTS